MKATALSALALLLLAAGALRADPPGVVERIEREGGQVRRGGPGGRVSVVRMPNRAGDADLAGLCELRGLEVLVFLDPLVSDDGLRSVSELRQLRHLALLRAGVTDEGLRHLEALTGLKQLDLYKCPYVTDGGVARLKKALPGCTINR